MNTNTADKVYICLINSWYHFLGFCAYLESRRCANGTIIVHVGGVVHNTPVIEYKKLDKYAKTVTITTSMEQLERELNHLTTSPKSLTLIAPSENPFNILRLLKKIKIKHDLIVIEEGIGTYGNYRQDLQASARAAYARSRTPKIITYLTHPIKSVIKKYIFRNIKRTHWFNFDLKTGKPNINVVDSYKIALSWLSLAPDASIAVDGQKIAVFVSSPFLELGLIQDEEAKKILKKILEHVDSETSLLIKPHPIEVEAKYEACKTVSAQIPFELLINRLETRPISIFCFSSTALYTSYILFGLKAERLASYDLFYTNLSRRQQQIIDNCSVAINIP